MSAEIVNLADRRAPPNPGNGAREALIDIASRYVEWKFQEAWADGLLAELWDRGFKVVPLE